MIFQDLAGAEKDQISGADLMAMIVAYDREIAFHDVLKRVARLRRAAPYVVTMKRRVAFMHGATQSAQIEPHREGVKNIPFLYFGKDLALLFNRAVIRGKCCRILLGAPAFWHHACGEVEHAMHPTDTEYPSLTQTGPCFNPMTGGRET